MDPRGALRSLSRLAALLLPLFGGGAAAQLALPDIVIRQKPHKLTRSRAPQRLQAAEASHVRPPPGRPTVAAPAVPSRPPAAAPLAEITSPRPPTPPPAELTSQTRLDRLQPKIGVNDYSLDRAAIAALPQGNETPLDKVLLQTPGVTQDSAASGGLHVRNEHANVQYRIDGILLPDGVSGFGQVLDTGFIGSLSLITGALPAQYGLRTAALVDIISRAPPATPGGNVTIYGGSHATGQTFFEYGAKSGQWEVFATGRLGV